MKGERTMDEQRKPRAREKKVVSEGKGVEKRGEGLGTGPVNNAGNYEDRRQQQSRSDPALSSSCDPVRAIFADDCLFRSGVLRQRGVDPAQRMK